MALIAFTDVGGAVQRARDLFAVVPSLDGDQTRTLLVVLGIGVALIGLFWDRIRRPNDVSTDTGRGVDDLSEMIRYERDVARRERDELRTELEDVRTAKQAEMEQAISDERERVKKEAVARVTAAFSGASAWLPDPTDLTTAAMSITDLDAALDRARIASESIVGPDPQFMFDYLSLGGRLGAVLHYRVESEIADKHASVLTDATHATVSGIRSGSISYSSDERGRRVSAWIKEQGAATSAPWRDDPSLFELIRLAGFRTRPLHDAVSVQWNGRWRIALPATGNDINGPSYVLDNGALRDWNALGDL